MEKEIIGYFCDRCGEYCGNEETNFEGYSVEGVDYCYACYQERKSEDESFDLEQKRCFMRGCNYD